MAIWSEFQVVMLTDFLGFGIGKKMKDISKIKEYWCIVEIFQCFPSRVITHYAEKCISLKYKLKHKFLILFQKSVTWIQVQILIFLAILDIFYLEYSENIHIHTSVYIYTYTYACIHTDVYIVYVHEYINIYQYLCK